MKQMRMAFKCKSTKQLARILSIFPGDSTVVRLKLGMEYLPDWIDLVIEDKTFPDVEADNLPISNGVLKEVDGKYQMSLYSAPETLVVTYTEK